MKFREYINEKKKTLPADVKKLIKEILKDKKRGLVMSHSQSMKVQSAWLNYFGQGGVTYPNTDENDMLKDLMEM